MKNTPAAILNAPLVRAAMDALIDTIGAASIKDEAACLAAVGGFMGCVAASMERPAAALGAMNAVARGIIDGSLLDP